MALKAYCVHDNRDGNFSDQMDGRQGSGVRCFGFFPVYPSSEHDKIQLNLNKVGFGLTPYFHIGSSWVTVYFLFSKLHNVIRVIINKNVPVSQCNRNCLNHEFEAKCSVTLFCYCLINISTCHY